MKIVPFISVLVIVALFIGRAPTQQHPPSRRHRVGLTHHTKETRHDASRTTHHHRHRAGSPRAHENHHWQTRLAAKLPNAVVVPSFTRDKRDLAGRSPISIQVISERTPPSPSSPTAPVCSPRCTGPCDTTCRSGRAARHTSRPGQTPRAAVPGRLPSCRTADGSPSRWPRSGFPASWRLARTTSSATSSACGPWPSAGQPPHRHRTRRPPQPLSGTASGSEPRPSSGSSTEACRHLTTVTWPRVPLPRPAAPDAQLSLRSRSSFHFRA